MRLKNTEGERKIGKKHFILCPKMFQVLVVFFGLTTQ